MKHIFLSGELTYIKSGRTKFTNNRSGINPSLHGTGAVHTFLSILTRGFHTLWASEHALGFVRRLTGPGLHLQDKHWDLANYMKELEFEGVFIN